MQVSSRPSPDKLEPAGAVTSSREVRCGDLCSVARARDKKQEFEIVESRHRVAVAAVTEAETMLGYARVTAPFPAVVTRKLAEVGDLAVPGKPLVELAGEMASLFIGRLAVPVLYFMVNARAGRSGH